MSLKDSLARLKNTKEQIRQSIIAKGVSVPAAAKLADFPSAIGSISSVDIEFGYINGVGKFQPLGFREDGAAFDEGPVREIGKLGTFVLPEGGLRFTLDANSSSATIRLDYAWGYDSDGEKVYDPLTTLQYRTQSNLVWRALNRASQTSSETITLSSSDTYVEFKNEGDHFTRRNTSLWKTGNPLVGSKLVIREGSVHASGSAEALYGGVMQPYCLFQAFAGNTGLLTPPELPSEVLAEHCYDQAFDGCSGLQSGVLLPAETLAVACYNAMFNGAFSSKAEAAVEIRGTSLANMSCRMMFRNSNVATIEVAFTEWTSDEAPFPTTDWVSGIRKGGTFRKPTALEEKYGTETDSYLPSGWTIVNKD